MPLPVSPPAPAASASPVDGEQKYAPSPSPPVRFSGDVPHIDLLNDLRQAGGSGWPGGSWLAPASSTRRGEDFDLEGRRGGGISAQGAKKYSELAHQYNSARVGWGGGCCLAFSLLAGPPPWMWGGGSPVL